MTQASLCGQYGQKLCSSKKTDKQAVIPAPVQVYKLPGVVQYWHTTKISNGKDMAQHT